MLCDEGGTDSQMQGTRYEKKSFPMRKPLSIVKKVQKIQYLR